MEIAWQVHYVAETKKPVIHMAIRATQPDNGNASHSVRIVLDGNYIGDIGPGGTVTGQSTAAANEPWHLVVTCGMFRAEATGLHDVFINIAWTIPAKMELRIVKN